MTNPPIARPSSTVVLVRDSAAGPEVLLLRRPPRGFAAGAWVFPGGVVDEDDYRLPPPSPEEQVRWARRLSVEDPGEAWGYVVAAVRETWEETGILLGQTAADRLEQEEARIAVLMEVEPFGAVADRLTLKPATSDLIYISRWITPEWLSRRFDTRFFVAPVERDSSATLHGDELMEAVWIAPSEALRRHNEGIYSMMPPTVHTLRSIADFDSSRSLLQELRSVPPRFFFPRMREDGEGINIDLEAE